MRSPSPTPSEVEKAFVVTHRITGDVGPSGEEGTSAGAGQSGRAGPSEDAGRGRNHARRDQGAVDGRVQDVRGEGWGERRSSEENDDDSDLEHVTSAPATRTAKTTTTMRTGGDDDWQDTPGSIRREHWLEPRLEGVFITVLDKETKENKAVPVIAKREKKFVDAFGLQRYRELIEMAPDGHLQGEWAELYNGEELVKCTQTEGRRYCAALYTESEFKDLMVEVHVYCRRQELRRFKSRYPFFCKYCEADFKDKNGLNYHRVLDACPKWNGPLSLKMYPVFDKSEKKLLDEECRKRGLTIPLSRPPAGKAVKSPGGERRPAKRGTLPSKRPSSALDTDIEEDSGHGRRKRRGQSGQAQGQQSGAVERTNTRASSRLPRRVQTPPSQKKPPEHAPRPRSSKCGTSKATYGDEGEIVLFGDSPHSARSQGVPDDRKRPAGRAPRDPMDPKRPSTRQAVLEEARKEAMFFTVQDVLSDVAEPLRTDAPGLFYLIHESESPILMDRELLLDPKACADRLLELVDQADFPNLLRNQLGNWFVHDPPKHLLLPHFPPPVIPKPPDIIMLCRSTASNLSSAEYADKIGEIRKLREYLQFVQDSREYEEKKKNAQAALEARREQYVAEKLRAFEDAEAMRSEQAAWGWSPLYVLLKRHPPVSGPQLPWKHTEAELCEILQAVKAGGEADPFTLENECPHIIRALKLWSRTALPRGAPLSHPVRGMTRANLLSKAADVRTSAEITRCVQDVASQGWLWFPHITRADDTVAECERDAAGLLCFEGYETEAVLRKTEHFFDRVAMRAVRELARTGDDSILRMLWCTSASDAERAQADEVFSEAVLRMEDIDSGWIGGPPPPIADLAEYKACRDSAQVALSRLRSFHLRVMYDDAAVRASRGGDDDSKASVGTGGKDGCVSLSAGDDPTEHPPESAPQPEPALDTATEQNLQPVFSQFPMGEGMSSQAAVPLPSQIDPLTAADLNLTQAFPVDASRSEELLLRAFERNPTPAARKVDSVGFSRTPQCLVLGLGPPVGGSPVSPVRHLDLNDVVANTATKEPSEPPPRAQPGLLGVDTVLREDNVQEGDDGVAGCSRVSDAVDAWLEKTSCPEPTGFALEFKGQKCKLRMEDLGAVERAGVDVPESLMTWFVIWKSDVLPATSCMCFPSVVPMLRSWADVHGEGFGSVQRFVREKFSEPRDFDVLMVPYHVSGQWALLYVCDHEFVHLACPTGKGPPLPQKVYKIVAKVWAVTCKYGRQEERWQRANKLESWRQVKSRVETSKWETGWYVMHFLATLCDGSGEGIDNLMATLAQEAVEWSDGHTSDARRFVADGLSSVFTTSASGRSEWSVQAIAQRPSAGDKDKQGEGSQSLGRSSATQGHKVKRLFKALLKRLAAPFGWEDIEALAVEFAYRTDGMPRVARLALADVRLLKNPHAPLSDNLMEWFVMWQGKDLDDTDLTLCSPKLAVRLARHVAREGAAYESISAFYFSDYCGLVHARGVDLVLPILVEEHWSVCVMTDTVLLHLDSMQRGEHMHGGHTLLTSLAKLWAVHAGHEPPSPLWTRCRTTVGWTAVSVPQQRSTWECGWYSMMFVKKFRERFGTRTDWTGSWCTFAANDVVALRGSLSDALLDVLQDSGDCQLCVVSRGPAGETQGWEKESLPEGAAAEKSSATSNSVHTLTMSTLRTAYRDEASRGYVEFVFDQGEVCTKLHPDPDMRNLDSAEGRMTSPLMDFFCGWKRGRLKGSSILLCTSFLWMMVRGLSDSLRFSEVQTFFEKKSGLKGSNCSTLLIPIVHHEHWSLAVLSEEAFLKFDSTNNGNFHGPQKLHECIAKLWCLTTGHSPGSEAWRRASSIQSWRHVRCPQQKDPWSCGFYVCCFIDLYLNAVLDGVPPDWSSDMTNAFGMSTVLDSKTSLKGCIVRALQSRGIDGVNCKVLLGLNDPPLQGGRSNEASGSSSVLRRTTEGPAGRA